MLMQTSQENGTKTWQKMTLILPHKGVAGLSCMSTAQSFGAPSYNLKCNFLPQRQNILPSLRHIAMSFPLCPCYAKMREHKLNIISVQPQIYCKEFEENSGLVLLARLPKLQLQTKHINVCYLHF
ncbi:hypothetical protein ACHAW6_005595 [Cyclotella cf. meneghiniana]